MTDTVVLEKLPAIRGSVSSDSGDYERRRIYIFATRQGLFFAFLLLVMLVLAINYSNSMAYAMTFLLGSLLMISMLHTYRNLRGLIIGSQAANPVFAGDILSYPLLIDNRTGQKRVAITIEAIAKKGKKRRPGNTFEPLVVNLPAAKLTRNNLLIRTASRGFLKPGRLRITSRFPLGLFKTWSYFEPERACIVYPKPAGSPQFPPYTDYESEQQSGKNAGTDDFTGFKPYRHGDSIRNIDWKAFAKEQPLQVKRFSGSGANKLILNWDQCGYPGDVERCLSQLCLWILHADREGFHYGLVIPGSSIDPGSGDFHMQKCLTALACYGLRKD